MACEECSDEYRSCIKRMNKVLRKVNTGLRRQLKKMHESKDEIFLALCETDNGAELAFRELWESGGFQSPIGPQDYEFIVKRCLLALREYNDNRMSLSVGTESD